MVFSTKKKILITGSNGYLGSHIAEKLIKDGNNVILSDISKNSIIDCPNYIQDDLLKPKKLIDILKDVEIIFFFTGRTGPADDSFKNPHEFILGNELTLVNLLKEVRILKKKPRIIFPSTRLIYKGSEVSSIDEDSCLEAKTIYAVNKIACENYLDLYQRCFDINYTIFRISLPYGSFIKSDKISHGVMSFLLNKAQKGEDLSIFGSGEQVGTFTHIKDLVNMLVLGSFNPETINKSYNVGGKNELNMKEVINAISNKYNVNASFVPWPDVSFFAEHGDIIFDSSKLKKEIDYDCKYDFFEWLERI